MKLSEFKKNEEAEVEETVDENELKEATGEILAEKIASYLDNKKAEGIAVLSVAEKTSLTSYLVVATGRSSTHVKSLGDEVDFQTSRRGLSPIGIEGRAGGAWVLLDYGPVIVHIFTEEARAFYNIEHLYCD